MFTHFQPYMLAVYRPRHRLPAAERAPRRTDHRVADHAGHRQPAGQHRARRHPVRRRLRSGPLWIPSRSWPWPSWWSASSSSPAHRWWPGTGGRTTDEMLGGARQRAIGRARRSRRCPWPAEGRPRRLRPRAVVGPQAAGRTRSWAPHRRPTPEAPGQASAGPPPAGRHSGVVTELGPHGPEEVGRHPGVAQRAVVVLPGQPGSGRSSRQAGLARQPRWCWATCRVSRLGTAPGTRPPRPAGGTRPAGRPGRTGRRCGRPPPGPTGARPDRHGWRRTWGAPTSISEEMPWMWVGPGSQPGVDQGAEGAHLVPEGSRTTTPTSTMRSWSGENPVVSTSTTANPDPRSPGSSTEHTVDGGCDTASGTRRRAGEDRRCTTVGPKGPP